MVSDDTHNLDIIEKLYAVAMEPERFAELKDIWRDRLDSALENGATNTEDPLPGLDVHIRRAESILTLLGQNSDNLSHSLSEKLESEAQAMFAIDVDGVICGRNRSAAEIYGISGKARIEDLSFDSEALAVLRHCLFNIRRGEMDSGRPILVRAARSDSDADVLLSLSCWTSASGIDLLIVKTSDFTWPSKLTPLISKAFGLTAAEADVLRLLAEGNSAKEIATLRSASLATVRTQIRAIYDKTSTRNQSEFMRMVMGLASMELIDRHTLVGAFFVPKGDAREPYPRETDRHLLRLPDGRLLDYSEFGAKDGRPCLFMHSEFFGDGCTAEFVDFAQRHDLRIIAPARPHNGRSSPYPSQVRTYDQANLDVVYLLDALGIDRVVVLSQVMAPSLFALMFAVNHSDRLAGMVLLAPAFPFGSADDERRLVSFHRFLASIIYRRKSMLKFISKAGMSFHNRVGSQRFFATFAEGRAADMAAVADPVAYAAMAQGAKISGAQGYEGYYNDYRCIPDKIEEKFLSISCPVKVIIGDTVNRKSFANLLRVVARKDNYREVSAVGGGQYTMFTHCRLVADTLAACWDEAAAERRPTSG